MLQSAGRGVAVKPDHARVSVLREVIREIGHPRSPVADLLPADELGGDIGHPGLSTAGRNRQPTAWRYGYVAGSGTGVTWRSARRATEANAAASYSAAACWSLLK
jgi:hypothetical protein